MSGVVWDDVEGIGAVPNARNVEYLGFVREMSATSFLALNPRRVRPSPFLDDAVRTRKPLGRPFLIVRPENGAWRVVGHEGRGRVGAIAAVLGGSTKIPVCVFPGRLRRRDLTVDQIEGWRFLPDPRCS